MTTDTIDGYAVTPIEQAVQVAPDNSKNEDIKELGMSDNYYDMAKNLIANGLSKQKAIAIVKTYELQISKALKESVNSFYTNRK